MNLIKNLVIYKLKELTQRKSRAERKELALWAILVRSQPGREKQRKKEKNSITRAFCAC